MPTDALRLGEAMPPAPASDCVSLAELTTWLGLTQRRVIQLAEEGIVVKEGRGKYPLKQSVVGYVAYLRKQAEGGGRRSDINEEKLLTARVERKRRELELAQYEGTLVTVASHEAAMGEAFDLVRSNIRNLPGSLAPRLVGMDDARDIQQILSTEVDDALRAIVSEAESHMDEDDSLPPDLPARKKFEAAGVTTITALRELDAYTSVPGIGPRTSERIRSWMEGRG